MRAGFPGFRRQYPGGWCKQPETLVVPVCKFFWTRAAIPGRSTIWSRPQGDRVVEAAPAWAAP